jgi:hypothetical protein
MLNISEYTTHIATNIYMLMRNMNMMQKEETYLLGVVAACMVIGWRKASGKLIVDLHIKGSMAGGGR